MLKDGVADELGDMGDYGVSEGANSVHPTGKHMISSASVGVYQSRPINFLAFEQALLPPGPCLPFTGVGNNPDTISLLRGANVVSRYAMPFCVIPERGQVSENGAHAETKQACCVFHKDELRSYLASQSAVFRPQSRPLTLHSGSPSDETDVLAGEPSADDIDGNSVSGQSVGCEFSNVMVAGDLGPVLLEDAARELLDLAEGDGLKPASPFEAQTKASDSAKNIEHPQRDRKPSSRSRWELAGAGGMRQLGRGE